MKQKDFTRLIDTIFAVKSGEEMLCSEYFDELPRYVDLEVGTRRRSIVARGQASYASVP